MRPRVALRVLALVVGLIALPLSLAYATHSPTVEQVVAVATGLGMRCAQLSTEVDCTGPEQYYFREPSGVLRPAAGPLLGISSRVNSHSNGIHDFLIEDRAWMTALHAAGCSDSEAEDGALAAFVDTVAATFEQSTTGGTYGPVPVAECSISGSLVLAAQRIPYWEIVSQVTGGAFPDTNAPATPATTTGRYAQAVANRDPDRLANADTQPHPSPNAHVVADADPDSFSLPRGLGGGNHVRARAVDPAARLGAARRKLGCISP